mmetsp:Transcript_18333/g.45003  ORF Transcript_18333/g.45003 Transcript_18333/m.45003 type:complete len:314 (-) Transcript_18333:215-1156(-)|eukprot:CAMPEP_0114522422 /NCGR_PEP_ID=MMETSP0109-20121206/20730_1 /TAXON_ID=29199 /ORGANISM="Chlorarachnion reptans, Strain CCCM449" /LENGTH=313 /DNA_ID=CAMNT_0001703631 /DNA_START=57 /DNA_END=998 /DNA_ORIENTATION=+
MAPTTTTASSSSSSNNNSAASLQAFEALHKDEIDLLSNGKIRCLITGHEMARDLNVMQKHWAGKSYKKKKRASSRTRVNLDDYEGIIPHKFNKNMAFCTLTKDTLNVDRKELENHVKGRRYRRKLEEWNEKKLRKKQHQEAAKAKAKRKSEREAKEDGGDFWKPPEEEDADEDGFIEDEEEEQPTNGFDSKIPNNSHRSKKQRNFKPRKRQREEFDDTSTSVRNSHKFPDDEDGGFEIAAAKEEEDDDEGFEIVSASATTGLEEETVNGHAESDVDAVREALSLQKKSEEQFNTRKKKKKNRRKGNKKSKRSD